MAKAFVNLYWDHVDENLFIGSLCDTLEEAEFNKMNSEVCIFLKCVELDIPVEGFK